MIKEIETDKTDHFKILPDVVETVWGGESFTDHLPKGVCISALDSKLRIESQDKALLGTVYKLMKNRLAGFETPFQKEVEIKGKGYSCQLKEKTVTFKVGYSHDVYFKFDPRVSLKILGGRRLILTSADKQLLGQTVAEIVKIKKPNPYFDCGMYVKGKAIIRKKSKK